jgi:hypothetical protein
MEQDETILVEVACFTEAYTADLARRFLRRSGVKAVVPEPLFSSLRHPSPQRWLYVPEEQVAKARRLLLQVVEGEFAADDPLSSTRRGLGAALAQKLLPAPGCVAPERWQLLAPVFLIPLALIVLWMAAAVLEKLSSDQRGF